MNLRFTYLLKMSLHTKGAHLLFLCLEPWCKDYERNIIKHVQNYANRARRTCQQRMDKPLLNSFQFSLYPKMGSRRLPNSGPAWDLYYFEVRFCNHVRMIYVVAETLYHAVRFVCLRLSFVSMWGYNLYSRSANGTNRPAFFILLEILSKGMRS